MGKVVEAIRAPGGDGIAPVPRERRVLGALDVAILWGDLGIGLLVLVTGALLVPALGFSVAMAAVVVGSIIGCALLGLAATAGARHGIPTMVLFRPVLGIQGSYGPSILNALQLIGWTAVELWAMSLVADLVAERIFGFSARPLWLAVAAVVCVGLALWGPVEVVRVWMKRFGAWVITAISIVVTLLLLTSGGIGEVLSSSGTGGFPTFGAALDLVIAMPVSWLPLVADYTRFSRRTGEAFIGTFTGYLVANVWLYALGALLVLSQGATPDPGGIAAGILALAGGSLAGILFLLGLLVGETDEAFADIYSGAVSLQNMWPRSSVRGLTLVIAALATGLAAWLNMARYEAFLFLLGSVFVPLFGILTADHFLNRRGDVDMASLYDDHGSYSGIRLRTFLPWATGFLVYHWTQPTGPSWWIDLVEVLPGAPLGGSAPWMSASILSFVAAFVLALDYPATHPDSRGER
jgi:NCS1 family nucleobase:cation symporter-1